MYLKVLGMEPLPAPKFQQRPWRFARKRRRSTNEAGDNEGKKFSFLNYILFYRKD